MSDNESAAARTQSQPECVVDLRPNSYQTSLRVFRFLLENSTADQQPLHAAICTPAGRLVEFHVRCDDYYVIEFKGADNWYHFTGERGATGMPSGVGANYSQLGAVGTVVYDDLKALAKLSEFSTGKIIDKRLCAILFGVTSEAARMSIPAAHFTGLTNSVGTEYAKYLILSGGVDFEYLRRNYFNNYGNPPSKDWATGNILLKPRRG